MINANVDSEAADAANGDADTSDADVTASRGIIVDGKGDTDANRYSQPLFGLGGPRLSIRIAAQ